MEADVGWRSGQARRVVLGLALVAMLGAAGCGSGGSSEADADAGPPTTASAADRDRATAARIVPGPADLPDFKPSPPPPTDVFYARCGLNPLLPGGDDARQAPVAGFTRAEPAPGQGQTVVGTHAVLAPDEAAAKVVLSTLRAPEFRACLERQLRARIDGDAGRAVVQEVAVNELAAPVLGNETVAFRMAVTTVDGRRTFDLTAVRRGRILAFITTTRSGGASFTEGERIQLARLMAARMG